MKYYQSVIDFIHCNIVITHMAEDRAIICVGLNQGIGRCFVCLFLMNFYCCCCCCCLLFRKFGTFLSFKGFAS